MSLSNTPKGFTGYHACEIDHHYGKNVHILHDTLSATLLARLCADNTVQPDVNFLIRRLYTHLFHATITSCFPQKHIQRNTRMIEHTPQGVWSGEIIDPSTKAVVVSVARGGIVPAQIAFDMLHEILNPAQIRQDHLVLERTTGKDGHVQGAMLGSAKIGGDWENAFVLIPDPMGATGSTISKVLSTYKEKKAGTARAILAMHLIVTPEYLQKVTKQHPEVTIYCLRLDRGLSSADILATTPGTYWEKERGLTDNDYIVPGAGGLGEVLNNSFI